MIDPLQFFLIFLKASLLSFGGLGNLPFLLSDLIALGWAQESDFLTAIAVGQMSPGPTGLWSISLGYLIYSWPGAVLSLIALLTVHSSAEPCWITGITALRSPMRTVAPM